MQLSRKSQDELFNGQSTAFQEEPAFTLQLLSPATRSRKLATTATRSVIEATTLLSRRAAIRSRRLATTVARPVIEAAALLSHRAATWSRKPGTTATRSVIDAWLIMSGNIQSEGQIQIDGKIKGDIRCTQLIVGLDATIIGDIAAEEVVVRGCVKGTIRADRIILQSTACVKGEIFHKVFAVEEGAAFDGQFHRSAEPLKASDKAEKWVTELQAMASAMRALDKPSDEPIEPKTVSVAA
jgi:cytoskeletal protein CcmA (bactofilin family)